jgi:hypothetical protein
MAVVDECRRRGGLDHCPLVLLALANRVLLQADQVGRPAARGVTTGVRPGYRQTPTGRRMACVTVWAIAADNSKETVELSAFLVKLSGRQRRHKQAFTHPALLAGLWIFLSMREIMAIYSQEEPDSLKVTAQQFLGEVV